MAHIVISGPTMCGKTTLAAQLARGYLARKIHVLVCDPFMGQWPATWQTTDRAAFLTAAKESRRCALFIDEAGQTISRDPDAEWLFTVARHWGHLTHVMAQGATQLLPLMRAQCAHLFLFGCAPRDAELWASEFNDPELLQAVNLPRFAFIQKTRFQPARVCRLAL
jgi:hypothetical protein